MDDHNVTGLVKGVERFIVIWADDQAEEALRVLGRWASNPELSFTWYDASVVSKRIRDEHELQEWRNHPLAGFRDLRLMFGRGRQRGR